MKKRNKTAKLISSLVGVLFFALLLFTVISTYMISQNRVPTVFGFGMMRVVSGSMEPEIPVGACILVHKTDTKTLKAGDIISFYSPDPSLKDMPNTHRIAEIKPDGSFATKGDANRKADDYTVPPDRVIGKMVGRIQLVEFLSGLLANPYIFFGLILLPVTGVSVYEIVRLIRGKNQKEE